VRVLPLYDELPRAPVEACERLPRDAACARCELSKGVKTVCVPAAGAPGGLLIVGEGPGKTEDAAGKPFVGKSGQYLRAQVLRHWSGPVVVANATGCFPGSNQERDPVDVVAKHVDACRPYLADVLARAKPTRVICVGAHAARAVTGRAVPPTKTRRGYAFLYWTRLAEVFSLRAANARAIGGSDGDLWAWAAGEAEEGRCGRENWDTALDVAVPVFFLLHPAAALRNKFMQQAFEDDLEWALTHDPPKPPLTATFGVVEDELDDLHAAIDAVEGEAAFDIEAAGTMYTRSYRVVSVAVARVHSVDETVAHVWPMAPATAPTYGLRRWLEEEKAPKCGAHAQYDINGLRQLGWRVRGVRNDVRLRRKLLEPHASGALDDMADLVGMGGYKRGADAVADRVAKTILNGLQEEKLRAKHAHVAAEALASGGKAKKPPKRKPEKQLELDAWRAFVSADPDMAAVISADPSWGARWGWVYAAMARLEPEVLHRYNAKDAVVTATLAPVIAARLAAVPALDRVRAEVVDHLPEVVAQVEAWGVPANEAAMRAFDAYLCAMIAPIEERLSAYQVVTNWNSTQQKGALLFDELGLKSNKRTAGGARSVDAAALKALKGQHPVVADMLERSRYTDLRKTFACGLDGASGMLPFIRDDGRMHPSILMDGTSTGRPSAHDPNLFNIPAKKFPVEGRMARDACCTAEDGTVILSFDYKQVELMEATNLSGDQKMAEHFKAGVDFHLRTAQTIAWRVWGIRPEDVTDRERAHAKNFIFGLLYGMGDFALACRMFDTQSPTDAQVAEARKIRAAIMGEYVGLAAWIAAEVRRVERTGESWTMLNGQPGRRRFLWDIADQDDGRRAHARNEAVNTPIQGGAADYLNRSMIAVVRWITAAGMADVLKVMLPIYDQLLMQARRDVVDDAAEVVPAIMTSWRCSVPLVTDVEIGRGWGSLRKTKHGPDGWKCLVAQGEDKVAIYTPPCASLLDAFDAAEELAA
jgi:uracil-DNA glycosylase family 4